MTNYSFGQLESIWLNAAQGTKYESAHWAQLMAAIALAESTGNPNATNPTDNHGTQTSWGLWQISLGNHNEPSPNWADPITNAKLAIGKLNTQGLGAWGTYASGAYKQFLSSTAPSSVSLSHQPNMPGGTPQSHQPNTTNPTPGVQDTSSILSWPQDILDFFTSADNVVSKLVWLVEPGSWIRIVAFIAGIALLLFAIHAFIAANRGEPIVKAPSTIPVPVPL